YNPSTWLPPDGPVFKGTVVRARAFGPNARPSDVATRTFFIDEAGEQRYSLPVVSIATDREHLFDYHRGIYVPGVHYRSGDPWTGNYFMRGPDWERPVSVEMFETDGSVAFSLNAGVRIHGGFSRALPTKTLRLYARSRYDKENWITHRIFPDRPVDRFKRVLLRNSGNDWGGHPWATYNNSEPGTLFRDPMMQRLVEHLGVDTQGYRPAIVFINGEYWGIHNFRQRYDNDYFETNYDISSDRLDLLVDLGEVSVGSRSHYDAMLHLTSSGLVNDESFRELETMMDVDNYTDYFIANIFFDNVDWPHKNADFWRFRRDGFNPGALPGQDGRWRWALFDTDFGFGLGGDHNPGASPYRNTLEHATQLNEGTALFRRMLQNGGYRHAFISRFADHLNSIFTTRRVTGVIDSMAAVIRPEVPEHLSRWRYPRSVFVWNGNVEVLREFARRRPDAVREHIRSRFGLAGYFDVEVDVSSTDHGTVRVNRLHLKPGSPGVSDKPYPWVGRYFQGVPVTITAVPRTGYRFARWESTVDVPQESILTLTRTDAATVVLRAVFEPDESDGMNPAAHMLAEAPYRLPEWSADRPANTFPNNMVFQQSSTLDPGLSDEMHSVWRHSYDLPARSRIVGLDGHGVAFINTSNPQEEGGGYVGAAVLAVDTENVDSVFVAWTGGTPRPNSRAYAFRLQYRVGTEEPFRDVLDRQGNPVEYRRNDREGHSAAVGPHVLPADASGRPYVQIRWKYYATGERHDDESGQRTMLRLADIVVANTASRVDHDSRPPEVERPELMPPAPNPFVEKTRVRFVLPRTGYARVAVFDVLGREVAVLVDGLVEGKSHEIMWPADDLPSGAYFLRLQAFGEVRTQQIMRLR
ncbi:MAG: CotH kinase family protein, partial [Bacteroidota bacterium]